MASTVISFRLNGRDIEALVGPAETVQTLVREKLGYTATKTGCKQGGCGSCTVLVNGQPMLSCLLPAADVDGQAVTTLEGLTPTHGLHPVQEAFFDKFAVQCGFCSPGMILVASALLEHNPNPTQDEIVDAITGNYCRCTGYAPIVEAIQDAAERMKMTEGA